jgi:hypothetical protein
MKTKHLLLLISLILSFYACKDDTDIIAPESNVSSNENTTIFLSNFPEYIEGKTLWILVNDGKKLIHQYKHTLEKNKVINIPLENEKHIINFFVPKNEKWLPWDWENINSKLGYGSIGTLKTTAEEQTITDWTDPTANNYRKVLYIDTPEINNINSFVKTDLIRFKLYYTSNIKDAEVTIKINIDGKAINHTAYFSKDYATIFIPTDGLSTSDKHQMTIDISNDKGYSKSIEEELSFDIIELENTVSINLKDYPISKSKYVLVKTLDGKTSYRYVLNAEANSTIKVPCQSNTIHCSLNVIDSLEYNCNLNKTPFLNATGYNLSIDDNYTIDDWKNENSALVPRVYGAINAFENFNSLVKGDLLKLLPDYKANLENCTIKSKKIYIDNKLVECYQPNQDSNATFIETSELEGGTHTLKLEIVDNKDNKAIDEVSFYLEELPNYYTINLNNFPVDQSKFVLIKTSENRTYSFKAENNKKINIPCKSETSSATIFINGEFDTDPTKNTDTEAIYKAEGNNLVINEEYAVYNWDEKNTYILKNMDVNVSGLDVNYNTGDYIVGHVAINMPFGSTPEIRYSIDGQNVQTKSDSSNNILINTVGLEKRVYEFKVFVNLGGNEDFEYKQKMKIDAGAPRQYSDENSSLKLSSPYNGIVINGDNETSFTFTSDIDLYTVKLYLGGTEIHEYEMPRNTKTVDLRPFEKDFVYGWNEIKVVGETNEGKIYTYYSNVFVEYLYLNDVSGILEDYAKGDIISGKVDVSYPEEMDVKISYMIDGKLMSTKSSVASEILFNTLNLTEGDHELTIEIEGPNSETVEYTSEFTINIGSPNPNTTQNTKIKLTNPDNGETINGDHDHDFIITSELALKSLVLYSNGDRVHEFKNPQLDNKFTLNPYVENLKPGNNELKLVGVDLEDNEYVYISNLSIRYVYLNSVSGLSTSYNIGDIISGELNLSYPENMELDINYKIDGSSYESKGIDKTELLFNTTNLEKGKHEISIKIVGDNNETVVDTITIDILDATPSSTTSQTSEIEITSPANAASSSISTDIDVSISSNVALSKLVLKCNGIVIENLVSPEMSNTISFNPSEKGLSTGWAELEATAIDTEGEKHIFISNIKLTEE